MVNPYIGTGVYTLTEAALYGSLSSHKLSRWLFGTMRDNAVLDAQFTKEHIVGFYDLVQAMAIDKARQADVSLSKIRQAIQYVSNTYSIVFPLAHKHQLFWFADNLHIEIPNITSPIQVSGKNKGQEVFKKIIEPFADNLTFDPSGLANAFVPLKKYGRSIILDPKKQFGQPLVSDTGYRADVLDNAYHAETSYDAAASEFGVDIKDVKIAVDYMSSLRAA